MSLPSLDDRNTDPVTDMPVPGAAAKPSAPSSFVSEERLWRDLMEMAELGALPGGGCARLSLDEHDRAARELFASKARAAGCDLRIDPFGNMFAIRYGSDRSLPVVLAGSHLDTQPHGGRFDGVYGVVAGLEAVRALNDAGCRTRASIAVVNWTNEEGVRFAPGLTGSKAFAGLIERPAVYAIVGQDGATFGEELARTGFSGDMEPASLPILAYVEPHIEQGPLLERLGKPIGVVASVQGVRWYRVRLVGADRHAGTTPMQDRRDSFMAAARLALEMRAFVNSLSPDARFTVGRAEVSGGSTNTVPGLTVCDIDMRHHDRAVLAQMSAELERLAAAVAREEGVSVEVTCTMDVEPIAFDPAIVEVLSRSAAHLGLPFEEMLSGAMHDASSIGKIAPTAMIFVPCRDGISHAETEWSEPHHLADGCRVLTRALEVLAGPARGR